MPADALDRDRAIRILTEAERDIRALGVERLALFGSVLKNSARPDSDVDVIVGFRTGTKTFRNFLALCDLLESRLGRRVDVLTTESLSPFVGPRILSEAHDVLRAA